MGELVAVGSWEGGFVEYYLLNVYFVAVCACSIEV